MLGTAAVTVLVQTGVMFLVRVKLPDRPGALGLVATAIGRSGSDIEAVEIVERGCGYAINHFMVEIAAEMAADALVSACAELPGVEVQWVSRYPGNWGIESDIAALEQMAHQPSQAREILTNLAPVLFHAQWATLIASDGSPRFCSDLAPRLEPDQAQIFLVTDSTRFDFAADWIPGWGETTTACAPLVDNSVIVLGRSGGPEFLDSELNRLRHLARLAG